MIGGRNLLPKSSVCTHDPGELKKRTQKIVPIAEILHEVRRDLTKRGPRLQINVDSFGGRY